MLSPKNYPSIFFSPAKAQRNISGSCAIFRFLDKFPWWILMTLCAFFILRTYHNMWFIKIMFDGSYGLCWYFFYKSEVAQVLMQGIKLKDSLVKKFFWIQDIPEHFWAAIHSLTTPYPSDMFYSHRKLYKVYKKELENKKRSKWRKNMMIGAIVAIAEKKSSTSYQFYFKWRKLLRYVLMIKCLRIFLYHLKFKFSNEILL